MRNIFNAIRKHLSSFNDWMWLNVSESKKTRFRTVTDFLVALIVFITCLFLYGKWNDVPKHTDIIEVACLKYRQPLSDTISDWNPVAIITYEINTSKLLRPRLRAGDIHVSYKNWKPYKRYDSLNLPVSRDTYVNDSLALHSDYWKLATLKRNTIAAIVSGKHSEDKMKELSNFISNRPNQFDEKSIHSQLESAVELQNRLLDSLKTYTKDSISWWIDNPTEDLYALFFFQINCRWNISEHKDYTSDPFRDDSSNAKAIGFWGYKDSAYYQNHYFLRLDKKRVDISDKDKIEGVDNPLISPKWYSMFDISQSYFDIALTSVSIDSVILKFDFVGATDFSEMNPKPDFIDMSSVSFSNPQKIEQIKKTGLVFHAHFKEKDGVQTIRLFAVTALMCVFTPKLLICIVNLIMLIIAGIRDCKLNKIKKKRKS